MPEIPFDISAPSRHDTSTYFGRVRQAFATNDPTSLLKSDDDVRAAVKLIDEYAAGNVDGTARAGELWDALDLKSSAVHPDTGEIMPRLLRFASFAPANVFICSAMLAQSTIASVPRTILVHFLNQSYNASINYANRNASKPTPISQLLQSFAGAVTASVGLALGATYLAKQGKLSTMARATVPFTAVMSASVINLVSMRRGELSEGVEVFDKDGTVHGSSVAAGRQGLEKCAITRVLINIPVMLFPPLLFGLLSHRIRSPQLKKLSEVGIVSGFVFAAVPPSIAVYPRVDSMETKDMEDDFRKLDTDRLFFNKGI